MDYLIRCATHAGRLLFKSPAFTLLSFTALALGIGAVTAMFSVINAAVIRGLPFQNPHELMFVKRWNDERQPWNTAIPVLDFRDISTRQTSFQALAGWFGGTVNVSIDGRPVRFNGSRISHQWLDILGVQPFIGRPFTADEDAPGAAPVLLLSHAAWHAHYSADPAVIGKTATINGRQGTVIGVMPPKFQFPQQDDVWVPLLSAINFDTLQRGDSGLNVMARLRSGVTREQATAEMTNLVLALGREHPTTNGEFTVGSVDPITGELLGEGTIRMMWIMLAMGGFVLLIACANVANLLLARSTLRTKELAIRSALGATRMSIIGQLLIESVLLSALGAIGGTVLALWATHALNEYGRMMQMPFWLSFDIDWRVLLLVIAATLVSGIVSGIAPAIKASRVSVTDILKDDTRTGSSLRMGLFSKGLVVVQVSIASILLILTVLMLRTVQNINNTDLHFDTSSVFTARMGLFEASYPTPQQRHTFYTTLRDNVAAHPDVAEAALYGRYRWTNTGINWGRIRADGSHVPAFDDLGMTTFEFISPQYFATLGVKLLEGRAFDTFDTADNLPVAIINQALAKHLFPGQNPLGQRFKREPWPQERDPATGLTPETPWFTVVGVAPNMAAQGIGNNTPADGRHYWLPLNAASTQNFMTIAARGPANPMALADIVRREIAKLDPDLPLYAVATPATIIAEDTVANRLIANIFKTFGVVAVFLSSIGIYGIMSFSVNQRTMEFGIRSALGASGNHILALVLRSGLIQFSIGLGLGLIGAFFFSKLLSNFLYGVSTQDPLNYVMVAVVFGCVAFTACLMPARRAVRIDPAHALRHE
jgi:putative ABC transport system permease protein